MELKRKICRSRVIADHLKAEISSGKLPPGSPLASVRALAAQFEVGPQVIVSALRLLEQDRLIQSLPRRGIRVADRIDGGKILIVTSGLLGDVYQFDTYFIPEFESLCRARNIVTERLPMELLRSATFTRLVRRGFTGVLLCACSYIGGEPEIALLKKLGVPVVLPHADTGDCDITGFGVIYCDFDRYWRESLAYLAQRGYRRIGAVGQWDKGRAALRCRPLGRHFELLRELKLEIPDDPVVFIDPARHEENRRKLGDWLRDFRRFDAILCHSDLYATQLYDWCQEKRLRIPDDLAVLGFGNYPGAELLSPPLSSVDYAPPRVAADALNLLLSAPRNGFPPGAVPRMVADVTVVSRFSTAQKKQGGKK